MDTGTQDIFPQIFIALVIAAVIFFLYMFVEKLYTSYLKYDSVRVEVYPFTGNQTKSFEQNPNNNNNIMLYTSEDQLTGIEFTYTSFIYISDETDTGVEGWRTIFYKGYASSPFPLCGPGVFVSSASPTNSAPTLRVIMNTYDKWFNPIDVKQIPFNKWFHLALVLRKNTMEVYVNGNLASKHSFNGTLPYQNYQSLNLFPNITTKVSDFKNDSANTVEKYGIPPGENFIIHGEASGYISNMRYYRYAASYSEIQADMARGPSSQMDIGSMDQPPYLIDTWWTQIKN